MARFSWRAAMAVWRRSFLLYRKTWVINLMPNFFEPVIYLLGFGLGLGAYVGRQMQGMDYLAFIAPGLVIANAMNGGVFESTYNMFVKIHFNRTYDAIIATPVSVADALLGETLWATTRGILYGAIFALVLIPFGVLTPVAVLQLLPLVGVTAWLFASLGMVFTAFIKVIDMFSFFFTLFLTPMFILSGIFFPVEGMPIWAQAVAWVTPLYHCVNLAKAAVYGPWDPMHLVDGVYIFTIAVASFGVGIRRIEANLVR